MIIKIFKKLIFYLDKFLKRSIFLFQPVLAIFQTLIIIYKHLFNYILLLLLLY